MFYIRLISDPVPRITVVRSVGLIITHVLRLYWVFSKISHVRVSYNDVVGGSSRVHPSSGNGEKIALMCSIIATTMGNSNEGNLSLMHSYTRQCQLSTWWWGSVLRGFACVVNNDSIRIGWNSRGKKNYHTWSCTQYRYRLSAAVGIRSHPGSINQMSIIISSCWKEFEVNGRVRQSSTTRSSIASAYTEL